VEARRRVVAPVLRLAPGMWTPPAPGAMGRGHLGFLLLEGLLARDETLAGSACTELVGPGEPFQPWTLDAEDALVLHSVSWTALQPTRLAVLGPSFLAATLPWPEVRTALLERAMRRCARISTHHALSHLNPVDARLIVLFWHLAERWGKVTRGGVLMPLRLSQGALGHLVGAKRPTVCLALSRLQEDGLIERRADRAWILRGSFEEVLERLGAGIRRPHGDAGLTRPHGDVCIATGALDRARTRA
jgi:CRP-like cAMP-binding protein